MLVVLLLKKNHVLLTRALFEGLQHNFQTWNVYTSLALQIRRNGRKFKLSEVGITSLSFYKIKGAKGARSKVWNKVIGPLTPTRHSEKECDMTQQTLCVMAQQNTDTNLRFKYHWFITYQIETFKKLSFKNSFTNSRTVNGFSRHDTRKTPVSRFT